MAPIEPVGRVHPVAPRGTDGMARRLEALLWPAPQPSWWGRGLERALAWAGFASGLAALSNVLSWPGVALASFAAVLLLDAACQRRAGLLAAVARWIGRASIALMLSFFAYESLAFGSMLAWAVPWMVRGAVAALAMTAVWTRLHTGAAARLPMVLPMGAWIGACLLAWMAEIDGARCDDFRRVVGQDAVAVILESDTSLRTCQPGTRVPVDGHPRKLFPAAEEGTLFTTVQRTSHGGGHAGAVFRGGLCAVDLPPLDPSASPEARPSIACREDLGGLYALSVLREGGALLVGGGMGLLRVSARPPFATLAEAPEGRHVSTLVHVPQVDPDAVLAFDDDMDRVERFELDSLRRTDARPLPIAPEEVRYDPLRREGLYCFASTPLFPIEGRPYLALAVGDDLSVVRRLGDGVPWAWLAFSDGCDMDPEDRRAYVGVGTLGLVAVLDYDTGTLLRTHAVGFGVRPLLLDARRGRLYAGNYLDGWVTELDAASGAHLRRWFVGRFVRHLLRDPRTPDALLVTSSLGVVRIELDGHPSTP